MNSRAATCFSTDVCCRPRADAAVAAGDKGYTLVEVMIAIVIFAVGILAAWALQHASTRGNTGARNLTIAAACASDRLEQLTHLPYTHADLLAGAHTPSQAADGLDNNFDGETDEAGETGALSIRWQVTDDVPIQETKTIRVDVTLRQRTISVTSHRANL